MTDDQAPVEIPEEVSVDALVRRCRDEARHLSETHPLKRVLVQCGVGLRELSQRLQLERQLFDALVVATESLMAASGDAALQVQPAQDPVGRAIHEVGQAYRALVSASVVLEEQRSPVRLM